MNCSDMGPGGGEGQPFQSGLLKGGSFPNAVLFSPVHHPPLPTLEPESRMSGLVPPTPHQARLLHRCHGDGKQWRVLLTLGEWGWAGGRRVGEGKTKCLRKRVPRTVGEQASNRGLRTPPPRGDRAPKSPRPSWPCCPTCGAPEETPGLQFSPLTALHHIPPGSMTSATPPRLTLADIPSSAPALQEPVAGGMKGQHGPGTKSAGSTAPTPRTARAPPPPALREGAGTLRRGGMNQKLGG